MLQKFQYSVCLPSTWAFLVWPFSLPLFFVTANGIATTATEEATIYVAVLGKLESSQQPPEASETSVL